MWSIWISIISKDPCIIEEKMKWSKGGGVGVCALRFWRFEAYKCRERRRDGREFQFLKVIKTNVLANEVVWHFFYLATKGSWESAKRVLRVKQSDLESHFIFYFLLKSFWRLFFSFRKRILTWQTQFKWIKLMRHTIKYLQWNLKKCSFPGTSKSCESGGNSLCKSLVYLCTFLIDRFTDLFLI